MNRPKWGLSKTAAMAAAGLLVLAACSSGSDESTVAEATPSPDGTAEEVSAESSANELSGNLTVWHNYNESVPGLFNAMKTWISNFEAAHPGVTVTDEYSDYDGFAQKVIAASIAGEAPDVIVITAPDIPNLYEAGAIADLTPLWNSYPDKDQFPAAVEDVLVLDGKQAAVQGFGNITGIYSNMSLLNELGLDMPTDAASFEAALQAATAAGKNGFTGVAMAGGAGEFFGSGLFASQGWSFSDPTNPGLGLSLAQQEKWVQNGWRSPNDSTGFVATDNFLTGNFLFAQDGNWQLQNYKENATFDWTVGTIPGIYETAVMGGEVAAMGANSQNPDAAWAFIKESFLDASGLQVAAEAGSIPLRADMQDNPTIVNDPALAGFAQLASNAIAIPLGANSGQVSALIGDNYSEVVAGTKSAVAATEAITGQLPGLLASDS